MRKVVIKRPSQPVKRGSGPNIYDTFILYAIFFIAMLFIFGMCKQCQPQSAKNVKTEFVKPQNPLK